MVYTSEQYKYLLLKRLQRHFSMKNDSDRHYTFSFFRNLLDETITVTEEQYNNFITTLDNFLDYSVAHEISASGDISQNDLDNNILELQGVFSSIGIQLQVIPGNDNDSNSYINFTKPNGQIMTYIVRDGGRNEFFINAKIGAEENYARLSQSYYNMEDIEVLELDSFERNGCGENCYWEYDGEVETLTIIGGKDSSLSSLPWIDEFIGGGPYNTLILAGNIEKINPSFLITSGLEAIVLLHSEDYPLVLFGDIVDSKNSYSLIVYTDNLVFRNYSWPDFVNITWYSLDEWEG